jgi:hypothetical protein
MGVDAQRDCRIGMAQAGGDDVNGYAREQQGCGVGCRRSCSRACGSREPRSDLLCVRISFVMSAVTVSG